MAVRSTKISRDVFNSCKQFVNLKSEIASIPCCRPYTKDVVEEDISSTAADDQDATTIRYIVTNTKRPEMLPKIEFPKNPEQLIPPEMRHLQPAMLPKFMELREDPENTKWEKVVNHPGPFPEPVKELRTETIRVSDKQKAELKLPNSIRVRFGNANVIHRNFCTSPYLIPIRSMASQDSGNKCKKNYDHRGHCKNEEEKIECDPSRKKGGCPRFILKECHQSKGSDCKHNYINPMCKKKNAPYPSYSETCAERLEGDPSECFQCPWHKCGVIDAMAPQKRKYHQLASSRLNVVTPSTVIPIYSPAVRTKKSGLGEGCEGEKKSKKPQCPVEKKEEVDICPKESDKKINYRRQRDLNGPEYPKDQQYK